MAGGIKPPNVPDPPKPPGSGGGGGGGGGSKPSGGSGSSGGSSGGGATAKKGVSPLTEDARKRIIDDLTAAWRLFVKKPGAKPPKELIDAALKTRGMDDATMRDWVRRNTPKDYLRTKTAQDRKLEITRLLRETLGEDFDIDEKTMDKLRLAYILGDPDKGDFKSFFQKNIRKLIPGFDAWFAKAQEKKGYATAYDALADYKEQRAKYQQWYRDEMGQTATIPEEFLSTALGNDWDEGQFRAQARTRPEWGGTEGAQKRDEEFLRQWDSLFSGTAFATPPAALMDKYRRGTMSFEDFIDSDIKDSAEFAAAFPEYAKWETAMHGLGYGEDVTNVWGYLQTRAGFIRTYREMMGDNSATPPDDLLSRAMMGKWSDEQFKTEVKAKDPKYTKTAEYKGRASAFEWYWKGIMGEQTPVDPGLLSRYASGAYSDPRELFEEIQGTPEFAAQYPDWATFSAAQSAAGNASRLMDNPEMYKQYAFDFDRALANAGLQMDPNFKHNFFASGLSPDEFANNLEYYITGSGAYQWQTGTNPDVQTVAGVVNPVTGGDIRRRMAAALEQHRTFARSSYQGYEVGKEAGKVARKI